MTTPTHTHTRTESVVMRQWNKPKDNGGVIWQHTEGDITFWVGRFQHGGITRVKTPEIGDWVVRRNGGIITEVITDAEKQAQGWKEIGE